MKIKNVIGFALASMLLFGGLTALSTNNQKVVEAEAAVHATNYADYTYTGSYYDGIVGTGDELRSQLTTLIYPKGWYTYGGSGSDHLSTVLQKADEDPENSSNMIYFYTRNSVTKNAASTWNREHCWPQSDSNGCWGTGSAGADLLHIRPTYNTTNSTRGNDLYGNASSYEDRVYEGMVYGKKGGGYFEPLDCVKGDAARICMYVWVAYYTHYGTKLPALTKVFSDFNTMMTWHINDKPDVLEGNRNNFSETSIQKNRNPFVDHPEYAWQIFGDKLSASVLAAAQAAYPAQPQQAISVSGVSVNPTSLDLEVGQTGTVTATVAPSNATNKKVTWSTGNSSIATVNNGVVTAVGQGETSITVTTTDGGFVANCVVRVTPKSTPVDPDLVNPGTDPDPVDPGTNPDPVDPNPGTDPDPVDPGTNPDPVNPDPGDGGQQSGGEEQPKTAAKLTSLEVTAPTKVDYKVGEQLDLTGFKAIAKYDDNSSKDVTGEVELDSVNMNKAGSKFVIVSYAENGVSVKGYFEIKVSEGSSSAMGCHGSIIASSALISITSLMGLGLLLLKKNKQK